MQNTDIPHPWALQVLQYIHVSVHICWPLDGSTTQHSFNWQTFVHMLQNILFFNFRDAKHHPYREHIFILLEKIHKYEMIEKSWGWQHLILHNSVLTDLPHDSHRWYIASHPPQQISLLMRQADKIKKPISLEASTVNPAVASKHSLKQCSNISASTQLVAC